MGRCRASLVVMVVCAGALSGCLERRLYITSQPSGALVRLNDTEVGRTPVEVDFTWFGVYDVRLSKEGYEPLLTKAEADAPIQEWPGIDLVGEAIPARLRSDVRWHFVLKRASDDPDDLIQRARGMREQLGGEDEPATEAAVPSQAPIRSEGEAEPAPTPEFPPLLPDPRTGEGKPR